MSNPTPNQNSNAAAQSAAAKAKAASQSADAADATESGEEDKQLAKAWGFSEGGSKYSKSTVFGVIAIVALLGLFGFAVVKNFRNRGATTAQKIVDDPNFTPASATGVANNKKSTNENLDELNGVSPKLNPPKQKSTGTLSLEEELSLEEGQSEPTETKVTSRKQTLPLNLDEQFDTSGDEPQPLPSTRKPKQTQLADEEPNFDQQAEPTRSTASLALEADESAEIDEPINIKTSEPARLKQHIVADSSEDEGFSEPIRVNATNRGQNEDFEPVPKRTQKPTRVARKDEFAQAPIDDIHDQPSSTTNLPPVRERSVAKLPTGRHPLLQEGEYLVEDRDNFCVISKKLYGSDKYFLALAEHNRQRVADPCRMQPGLVILAPSLAALESQHATLIPKPKVEVEAKGDKPHATKKVTAAVQPAGLFFDDQGAPWYRVGKGDTLQGIAKSHLGRMTRAEQIFNLNRERLADPDDLRLGQELRLPNDASQVRLVESEKSLR